MKRGKSGQATIEFLPAALLFLMVMSASMAYFRIIRWATIRQEIVRNIAFAAISNSGTLTTPGELALGSGAQTAAPLDFNYRSPASGPIAQVLVEAANVNGGNLIGAAARCFIVYPFEASGEAPVEKIYGMVGNPPGVRILSYAIVQKGSIGANALGDCAP